MYPKFDTVNGKGMARFNLGLQSFKSLPSIINQDMKEGLAKEEIESEALINSINTDAYEAADELGGGKQSLSAAGLEPSVLGGKRLSKSLGWLSDSDTMSIEDFTDNASPVTRNNYMKIQRGDTGSVLAQLKSEKPATGDALEVFSFFVPKIDAETGQYILKEVVGTRDELAKLELAGSTVINEYGPKKYSENSLLAGTKAFVKGMHSTWPGLHSFGAGAGDLAEATANLFTKGEFKAEYTDLNAKADYLKRDLDNTIYGQTTLQADQGMFDNLNAFSNVMGQASSSLAQYAITGNMVGAALRGVGAVGKGLAAVAGEGSLGAIGSGIHKAIQSSPEILPMVSAGMLLNYGEAYDSARQAGIPLEDAAIVGFTTGALNTMIEMKFGSNVMNRWLVGGKGAKKAAETIVRETNGNMAKLYDKGVSNAIVNKLMNSVEAFTRTPVIGQAFEEGSEEILQGIMKNSVEMVYDQFVAPDNVELGKGRFGTKFDKQSFKSLLEEGAAGAIMGALGGFSMSRQKENRSIIPFLASGEMESLTAGANVALSKGAITQAQYDGIMGRAKALNNLRNENNDLFSRVIGYDTQYQQPVAEALLTSLRDQEDFAKGEIKKADGTPFTEKEKLEQFGKLVLGSRSFALPEGRIALSTTEAFEKQLRKNGKVIEADLLNTALKDTKDKVNELLGSRPVLSSTTEKRAWDTTATVVSDNIFHNQFAISLNNERIRQLSGTMNTIDAKNNGAITAALLTMPNSEKYDNDIAKAVEELKDHKTTDKRKDQLLEGVKRTIAKKYTEFKKNNPSLTDINSYTEAALEQELTSIYNLVAKTSLEKFVKDKKGVEEVHGNITNVMNRIEEAKAQKEAEKKVAEEARTDEYYENLLNGDFKSFIDLEIASEGISEEDSRVLDMGKIGYLPDTIAAIQLLKKRITDKLNNKSTTADEKQVLRTRLVGLNELAKYVTAKKARIDKALEDSTPTLEEASFAGLSKTVVDKDGKEYKIDPTKTKRSNTDKFIYTITDKEGNDIEVKGEDLPNYRVKEETEIDRTEKSIEEKIQSIEEARRTALNKLYTNNGKLNADDAFFNASHQYSLAELATVTAERFPDKTYDEASLKAKRKLSIKEYKDRADEINKKYDEQIAAAKQAVKEVKNKKIETPTKGLDEIANEHEAAYQEKQYKMSLTEDTRTSFESERDPRPLKESSDDQSYEGRIRVAVVNPKLEELINQPGVDVSRMTVDATVSSNIESLDNTKYKKEIEAARLFDKLLKTANPVESFNNLDEAVRNELIYSLPIEFTIWNLGVANKGYTFTRDGAKGNYREKTLLMLAMLRNKGGVSLPAGSVTRTPGYLNYKNPNSNLTSALNLKENKKTGNLEFADGTPLMIGISDSNGVIYYNDNREGTEQLKPAKAIGGKGTPYLIIPPNKTLTGNEGYVAKLNPGKIPLDVADVIANLMLDVVNKKVHLNDIIPPKNAYGVKVSAQSGLTYANLLNDLIFLGSHTIKKADNNVVQSKQLLLDFESGSIKYGPRLTPVVPTDPSSVGSFINWMAANKNYSLNRHRINLNAMNEHTYTLTTKEGTSISFKEGERYLTSLVNNGFIKTDLDAKAGLHKSAYLTIGGIKPDAAYSPVASKEKTTPEAKTAVPQGASQTKKTYTTSTVNEKFVFNSKGMLADITNMPDGTVITMSTGRASNKRFYGIVDLVKNGDVIALSDGTPVITISEHTNDNDFAEALRAALAIEYNNVVETIIGDKTREFTDTVDGQKETVVESAVSFKIPVVHEKGGKVTVSTAWVKTVTFTPAVVVTTKNTPTVIVETAAKQSIVGYSDSNNIFTDEIKNATGDTTQLQKLYNDYAKLLKYLAGITDKTSYLSAVHNILTDYDYATVGDLSGKDLETLVNYKLSNGASVGSILLSLGNSLGTTKESTLKINEAPVVPVVVKPVVTEVSGTQLVGTESISDLATMVSDQAKFNTTVATLMEDIDMMDDAEIASAVDSLNKQLHEVASGYDLAMRRGNLKLIASQPVAPEVEPAASVAEVPVAAKIDDISPESINAIAGVTFERNKPKPTGKFGGKKKPPMVPMEINEFEVLNGYEKMEAEKELRIYRRMFSRATGGNIEFVSKLIETLGASGNPVLAYAVMHKDGVTLFDQAMEGAIYHEAFHRVSLLFLSNSERAAMYQQARKDYSLYNRSDKEVEEFLADKFREYVLNNKTVISSSPVKSFFKDLWTFIKSLLGFKPEFTDINGLFNAILNGKYKFSKIITGSYAAFEQAYGNETPVPLTINDVTFREIKDSSILSSMVNSLTALTLDFNDIQSIQDISNKLDFTLTLHHLIDTRAKYREASQREDISQAMKDVYGKLERMYSEVIENYNSVIRPLIEVKLQGYNIKRIDDIVSYRDDLVDLINDELHSSYEFSAKENAQTDIRVTFLTLKSSGKLDPVTFMEQYVNPDVAWFNTFSLIHKAKSIQEITDKLRKAAEETNTLRQTLGDSDTINMYSELYNRLIEGDEMYRTRFWNTFKKHRHNFINVYYNQETSDKGKKLNSFDMRFGDADINKRSKRIEMNWSSLFGVNGTYTNHTVLRNAIADWKTLVSKAIKNPKSINYIDTVREIQRILATIDVTIDEQTIGLILNEHFFNSNLNQALVNFLIDTPSIGAKHGKIGLNHMFGENGILNKIITNDVAGIDELTYLTDEHGIRMLAGAYVKANPTAEDDSVLGPDGNLVYAYSEHNTITVMFEQWLKDRNFLKQLQSATYNKSSYWLSQLIDPRTGEINEKALAKVSVDTMLSVINTDAYDRGRGYLEIGDAEDILVKFNAIRGGKSILPTLANKRTYYFVNGLKKMKVALDSKGQLNKEVIDQFTRYAIGEYQTMKAAEQAKETFLGRVKMTAEVWDKLSAEEQVATLKKNNTDYKDLVENYHYGLSGDKIVLSKGNGYKFRYFHQFESIKDKEAFFNENNTELKAAISSMLNQQVNETIKLFISKRLIAGDSEYLGEDKLKEKDSARVNKNIIKNNILLPKQNLVNENNSNDAKSNMAEAIADYAINNAISVLEFEKLVSGDLAFYKVGNQQKMIEDRIKRYSALTSTRSLLRQDFPADFLDFDQNEYNVVTFKSNILDSFDMKEQMLNMYLGTPEKPGALYGPYLRFRDDKVAGFDTLTDEELFEKAKIDANNRLANYNKVDQTDAQVLISPAMFRKLSILNGEWNDAKEEALNMLESDDELTVDEEMFAYSVIMQPLKYIHFGYDFKNQLQTPIYDKMSLATVFKRIAKGRDLMHVYDLMKNGDIDMIKFDTATKVGNKQKTSLYDSEGNINKELSNPPVFKQEFKYLGKQLVTDPHHVSRIPLGTQFVKIGVSGVMANDDYTIGNVNYKGSRIMKEYAESIARLSDIGKDQLYRDFGIKETKETVNGVETSFLTMNKEKFIAMLKDDAISSNSPANLVDALRTVDTENGEEYYIELSTLPSLNWIHSRIISMIKKATIDVNTPGGAMIQISNFGFSSVELGAKYRGTSFDKRGYALDKNLKFRNEDGRMEAIVSINLFKDVLPKYLHEQAKNNNRSYFEEAKAYILANPDLAVLGYRIPTQGMNSTLAITVVDVIESTIGDAIILPSEITTLTGADFDIDKMYIARYNYIDANGSMEKIEFIDDYIGLDEDGNDMFLSDEDYLRKVYDYKYKYFTGKFFEAAKRDIPSLLQAVMADLNKSGQKELSEHHLDMIEAIVSRYKPFLQERSINNILRNNKLDGRKKLLRIGDYFKTEQEIPSFADFYEANKDKNKWELNNPKQIENRLLDIFNSVITSDNSYIDTTTPLDFAVDSIKSIVKFVDEHSNTGSSVSGLDALFPYYQEIVKTQNTGADNGIGPMALINTFRVLMQMAKLNIDRTVTFKQRDGSFRNLVTELGIQSLYEKYDRNGVPIMDWTSALITAHVDAAKDSYITRLNVNAYTHDIISFLITSGFGKSSFLFLSQPILKQVANEYLRVQASNLGISKKDKLKKVWQKRIISIFERGAKVKGVGISKNLTYLTSLNDKIFDETWLKKQIATPVNQRNEQWYTDQLAIFQYFTDIQRYSQSLKNFILASQVDTGKFGKNSSELLSFLRSIERADNTSMLVSDTGTSAIQALFNDTFLGKKLDNSVMLTYRLLGADMLEFSPLFKSMLDEFGKLTDTYFDYDTRISNQATSELRFAVTSKFFNEYAAQNNVNIKELFYGDNTIVDRLNRIRTAAMTGQDYFSLRDNALLRLLIPGINKEGEPKRFETVLKQRDTESKNLYTFAWRDMLEHSSETVRGAARDLILYAYYSSGGRASGVYSMLDLVPYEVLANMSYKKGDSEYTYNNYMKDFMKDANSESMPIASTEFLEYAMKAMADNDKIVPVPDVSSSNTMLDSNGNIAYLMLDQDETELYTSSTGTLPLLIKQVTVNSKGEDNFNLYKFIGFSHRVTNGVSVARPVYALTNKINAKVGSFTVNEGSLDTFIDANMIPDYTKMQLPFTESFKTNVGIFIANDSNIVMNENESYKEEAEFEMITRDELLDDYQNNQKAVEYTVEKAKVPYSRKSVEADKNTLYIFTDNTDRTSGSTENVGGWYAEKYGNGLSFGTVNNPTTAVIRGLDNAYPISTMKWFYKNHGVSVNDARWTDNDLVEFMAVIDDEINTIKNVMRSGKYTKIVTPQGDGFFNSKISNITPERTPELYKYLSEKLKELDAAQSSEPTLDNNNFNDTTEYPDDAINTCKGK